MSRKDSFYGHIARRGLANDDHVDDKDCQDLLAVLNEVVGMD